MSSQIVNSSLNISNMSPEYLQKGIQGIVGQPFQVSPLGSADPKWQEILNSKAPLPAVSMSMNPIMEKFASLGNDKTLYNTLVSNPILQTKLFDTDNAVKSNAGISRMKTDGHQEFGIDADGKPLYAIPEYLQENKNFRLGQNQLSVYGATLDSLGAFKNKDEALRLANYAKAAGSPGFQGQLTATIQNGDHKGAVNTILTTLGKPEIDNLNHKDAGELSTAFAAHNLVGSWGSLNPTQRSMALSAIAVGSYRDADGNPITERTLIEPSPGNPGLNVKTALGLTAAGTNVPALMKNWDQLDVLHRISYGDATPSKMAVFGRQFGLLADRQNGNAAVKVDAQQLGQIGFKAAPSTGVGAISGPSINLPPGYTVIGSGDKPGTVIAVPQGHEGTAVTMNGSSNLSSLNPGVGGVPVSSEAAKVYSRWGAQPTQQLNGVVGGTSMMQGLNTLAQNNPYVMSAIVAANAHGNTLGLRAQETRQAPPQVTTEDAARGIRQGLENTVVSSATGIPVGTIQKYGDQATGGAVTKVRNTMDKLDPIKMGQDKLLAKGLDLASKKGLFGGTTNQEHASRNMVRKAMVNTGMFDDGYNVTLADGTKYYAGSDGDKGQHEFRHPELAVEGGGKGRSLSAYDVDYTNDLDYSANLMTLSLMRIIGGGKGTPIDQVAGQMANAALSQVGYGQDNTPENFAKVQANARAFYAQAGIKSKEDAYALVNQAFAEHRINEMDLTQMQQGLNLAFDEKGHETSQALLSWKDKGIQVATQMPNAPGPIFDFNKIPPGQMLPWQFPETPDYAPDESGPIYDFTKIPPGQILPWHFPNYTPSYKPSANSPYGPGYEASPNNPYGLPSEQVVATGGTYWGNPIAYFQNALNEATDPVDGQQQYLRAAQAGFNSRHITPTPMPGMPSSGGY